MKFKKLLIEIKNSIRPIRNLFKKYFFEYKKKNSETFAYDKFREFELESSYNHFKKYFYDAIFLNKRDLRKYAIKNALKLDQNEENLFLEFGVYKGETANFFSSFLKKNLFAFDSFKGLEEDWKGYHHQAGDFGDIEIPQVNSNINLIIGNVRDTLPDFIVKNNSKKIIFVHMDLDNYSATKFVLDNLKPHLNDEAIICFDELYNYQGWKSGEYKALTETFLEDEIKFKCFAADGQQVVIQYKKKSY